MVLNPSRSKIQSYWKDLAQDKYFEWNWNPPAQINVCECLFLDWRKPRSPCGLQPTHHPHRPESHHKSRLPLSIFQIQLWCYSLVVHLVVLPGWEFTFPWGFQHPSQSKTDWGFSEIALSFIRFFPASKGFQQQVNSTSPTSNTEGRAKSWVQPLKRLFLKKRAAVVVAALLKTFLTHVQFFNHIVAQMKALGKRILNHP